MPPRVEYVILHCTDAPWGSVESVRKFHTDPKPAGNGWLDIGYHYLIGNSYPTLERFLHQRPDLENDGTIFPGRDLDHDGDVEEEIGAHVEGWNSKSLGVALVGRVRQFGENAGGGFTSAQIRSALHLIRDLCHRHEVPFSNVLGHYETGAPKSCPDLDMEFIRELLRDAAWEPSSPSLTRSPSPRT